MNVEEVRETTTQPGTTVHEMRIIDRHRDKKINFSPAQITSFWSRVDRSGGENSCWEWQGTKFSNGYGCFTVNRTSYSANRIAYELEIGPLGSMLACHRCDNPSCCNPNHLFKGSSLDNSRDMVAKGRSPRGLRQGKHTHPESRSYGEENGNVVLNEELVRKARRLRQEENLTHRAIAAIIGVDRSTVSQILSNKTWRGV